MAIVDRSRRTKQPSDRRFRGGVLQYVYLLRVKSLWIGGFGKAAVRINMLA